MSMDFGIASVAAITAICYFIGMVGKAVKIDKWIPSVVGFAGLLLGLIGYYIKMPDFPAQDVLTAAAVGVASGLAATGVNQIFKQAEKDE